MIQTKERKKMNEPKISETCALVKCVANEIDALLREIEESEESEETLEIPTIEKEGALA